MSLFSGTAHRVYKQLSKQQSKQQSKQLKKNKEDTCPLYFVLVCDIVLLFFDRKEFYFEDEG